MPWYYMMFVAALVEIGIEMEDTVCEACGRQLFDQFYSFEDEDGVQICYCGMHCLEAIMGWPCSLEMEIEYD